VVLLVVVVLTTIVVGLVSILALHSAQLYRQRRADSVRSVARALAASGAAYARSHLNPVPASVPTSIELEVASLLPKGTTGSLVLAFPVIDGEPVCRVTAKADMGGYQAMDEIDLELARTQPAP